MTRLNLRSFWDNATVHKFVQIEHMSKTLMKFPHVFLCAVQGKQNVVKRLGRALLKGEAVAVLKDGNRRELRVGTACNRICGERDDLRTQFVIVKSIGGLARGH